MNIIEKQLGTSILRTEFITISNSGKIIFNGAPIISVAQFEKRVSVTVFDNHGLDAINVAFIFAKKPKNFRAMRGAAKIVARHLLKILRTADISAVSFFANGKETSAAAKSGLALLKKFGIKIS